MPIIPVLMSVYDCHTIGHINPEISSYVSEVGHDDKSMWNV